jgi:DNA-directed RNA polymerase specialized sigma24 family protein
MTDDPELLRLYAHDRSEAAFAELVQRHLGWIYRTALRRTGRTDFAQDVVQYVFIALGEQAAVLAKRDQLAGWFYLTIRNAAYQLRRSEVRRWVPRLSPGMK